MRNSLLSSLLLPRYEPIPIETASPCLVWAIDLAYQSHVREMQHFVMAEKRRERGTGPNIALRCYVFMHTPF